MGSLDPSQRETKLHAKQFLEAAKLQGTHVKVKLVLDVTRDLYKDPDYEYKDRREMDVILDVRPNRNVLESYGWYNEHDEQIPVIMYMTKYDEQENIVKPTVGTIVSLPYELAEDEKFERHYQVANAVLENPNSWLWVCKLAPYRKPAHNTEPEYELDPNYDFLNVRK